MQERSFVMLKNSKTAKPCPTDLTLEEQNPSSYRLNDKVLTKLERTIERVKNGKTRSSKSRK